MPPKPPMSDRRTASEHSTQHAARSTPAADAPQVLAGKSVGVVGGGPGGMLCAAHLARLGAAVEVFERHDPGTADAGGAPAVWTIALGSGAREAIEAAGLSPDFGPKWRSEGLAAYSAGSEPTFVGDWVDEKSPAVERLALATQPGIVAHLRAECERMYGDAVRVRAGVRAVGGDVCGGEVVLEDAAGQRTARRFDMVVGADGAGSTVRKLMQEQDGSMDVRIDQSAIGISCCAIASTGPVNSFATLPTPSGTPFHATPPAFDGALEGCATGFVMPAPDGPNDIGFCAVAVCHGGSAVSLAVTGDAAALRQRMPLEDGAARLEAAYPQLPTPWLRQTAEFLADPGVADELLVRRPRFVTCSKIASGRAVLLGDAAHALSPNLGMGCNAALQDSEALARACIAAGGDVAATADRYNAARLEFAHELVFVSRQMDAFASIKYHRDTRRALAGFPYFLAGEVGNIPDSFGVPGILRPGFSTLQVFQEADAWRGIRAAVLLYTARVAAVVFAAAALAGASAWAATTLLLSVLRGAP